MTLINKILLESYGVLYNHEDDLIRSYYGFLQRESHFTVDEKRTITRNIEKYKKDDSELPTESVFITSLINVQGPSIKSSSLPLVVRLHGVNFLVDKHNSQFENILGNTQKIQVKIYNLDLLIYK
jgi:hypothetical protein